MKPHMTYAKSTLASSAAVRFHNLLQTLISHLERHDICGAVNTTLYGEIGQTLFQGLGPQDYVRDTEQ